MGIVHVKCIEQLRVAVRDGMSLLMRRIFVLCKELMRLLTMRRHALRLHNRVIVISASCF